MAYDAFVSYSHAVDGHLAPAVQAGLQRLARPWYQVRALRVFRDDTGLAVNPHLWGSIATAIDQSRYFVLLTSPEAAASPWVNREIDHWVAQHGVEQILPVLTSGTLVWDASRNDYDAAASTALPPALKGHFSEEPRHLDLRWARDEEHLKLRNSRFREAIADIAAPLHGLAKDELESEDARQHRRTRRLARTAVASLALLLAMSLVAGGFAVVNARRAEREATVANARRLAAEAVTRVRSAPDPAVLLAVEAHRLRDSPETRSALLAVLQRTSTLKRLVTGFRAGEVVSGLSRDGTTLAVSDKRGRVALVDMQTRKRRESFVTGQRAQLAAYFSSDGSTLATTSPDHTVRLWDAATGRPLTPILEGHDYPVSAASFSSYGDMLATEDSSGGGIVRAVPSGQLLAHIPQVVGGSDVAFSPDGRRLAVAADGTQVFDVATMASIFRAPSHKLSEDAALAFSPDGSLLAVPNWPDRVIEFYDALSGALRSQTAKFESAASVSRVMFSPDGSRLIGGMGNGTIISWDVGTGSTIGESLAGHSEAVTGLAVSGDGELISSSVAGAAAWSLDGAVPLTTRTGVTELLLSDVAISHDGRVIAVLDTVGRVFLRDGHTLGPLGPPVEVGRFGNGVFPGLAFSPDGHFIAVADRAGTLSYFDVRTGQMQRPPLRVTATLGPNGIDLNPSGREVAVGGGDGAVVVVDIDGWRVRQSENVHQNLPVLSVDFSPDGKLLASGGADGRVVLEQTADRRAVVAAKATSAASAVKFSPDGQHVAAGFEDGTVVIIDAAKHTPVGSALTGHSGQVTDVQFSADGGLLAVASDGGTVALWDVETRQRIGDDFRGDSRTVNGLAFAPEKNTLVGVGGESTLVRWNLDPVAWMRRACAVAGRNLTRAEWDQYFEGEPYRRTCRQWPQP